MPVLTPAKGYNAGDNCYNEVGNGGFEDFTNGKPRWWTVSSADAYPLADSTWFQSGHYGAYLGGYDDLNFRSIDDSLKQYIYIPTDARSADLSYAWYVHSEESPSATIPYDQLHIRLRDVASGNIVIELATLSNLSPRDTWGTAHFNLLAYTGQGLHLALEADTDISKPTSFFVDNLSLWICRPGMAGPMPTETPTPTYTPQPATDWTFEGEVSAMGGSPIPAANLTLYRAAGSAWQAVGSAMTGNDGRFRLSYSGPPDPEWFLILVQYPSGYTPAYAQAGPHFLALPGQMVIAVQPLPPGTYGGQRFVGLYVPHATPLPGTPTPPPLPTLPLPPPWATPTLVSPLATPTP